MRYLFWLLALALSLPAGAQRRMPPKTKAEIAKARAAKAAAAKSAEPVLVYQRTPCYGRCPVYTATIFADGRVEYDGQRFVPVLGKHTLTLPVATVNQLLAEAERINFNKLDEQYKGNTTDLPTTIVTVHPPGRPLKAVVAESEIPANLQGYLDYLRRKLDPLAGIGIEE